MEAMELQLAHFVVTRGIPVADSMLTVPQGNHHDPSSTQRLTPPPLPPVYLPGLLMITSLLVSFLFSGLYVVPMALAVLLGYWMRKQALFTLVIIFSHELFGVWLVVLNLLNNLMLLTLVVSVILCRKLVPALFHRLSHEYILFRSKWIGDVQHSTLRANVAAGKEKALLISTFGNGNEADAFFSPTSAVESLQLELGGVVHRVDALVHFLCSCLDSARLWPSSLRALHVSCPDADAGVPLGTTRRLLECLARHLPAAPQLTQLALQDPAGAHVAPFLEVLRVCRTVSSLQLVVGTRHQPLTEEHSLSLVEALCPHEAPRLTSLVFSDVCDAHYHARLKPLLLGLQSLSFAPRTDDITWLQELRHLAHLRVTLSGRELSPQLMQGVSALTVDSLVLSFYRAQLGAQPLDFSIVKRLKTFVLNTTFLPLPHTQRLFESIPCLAETTVFNFRSPTNERADVSLMRDLITRSPPRVVHSLMISCNFNLATVYGSLGSCHALAEFMINGHPEHCAESDLRALDANHSLARVLFNGQSCCAALTRRNAATRARCVSSSVALIVCLIRKGMPRGVARLFGKRYYERFVGTDAHHVAIG